MRKRYLMFKESEWAEFKDKLNEDARIKAKAAEKSNYVKKLIEDSDNLKKDWDDTYEKIIARQEEEREKRKLAENVSRMNFYKQYLEQKRIERDQMLAQADDFNFRQRDEPKTLISSLLCAETLRQVAIQKQFNEKLRLEKLEEEVEKSKAVKAHAEDWAKEIAERRRRKREENIEIAKYIKQQHTDKQKLLHDAKMERLAVEREDVIKAADEMEQLRQHDINTKLKHRDTVKKQGEMAMDLVRKRRHENKVLEEMENKMIEVYLDVTCKIKYITKQKQKEAADEKERFNELTQSRFPRLEAILWAKEERSMQKAQEQYERKEVETIKMKKAKVDAINEDKREQYRIWLKQQEVVKENEDAMRKWEIANRLENDELTKQFKEREMLLRTKKMKEYTDFLDQQKRDLADKKKTEKEEVHNFYHTQRLDSLKIINDKFIAYSTNLVEECKQAGRPTRPLEKVIADYKAKYMAPPRKIPSRYLKPCPPNNEPKK